MTEAFQDKLLPTSCSLIGYSWLLHNFDINVHLRELCCISKKRLAAQKTQKSGWAVFDAQLSVSETPYANLEFALKHETIDLLILKEILRAFPKENLLENIQLNPKRILAKKIWFFYEFLLNERLPLSDLPASKYDNVLDEKIYIVRNTPIKSKRHKLNNNLLGTASMCPIIKKTKKLQEFLDIDFSSDISKVIGKVSKSLVQRAASFLLLSDSKASFEIEGEWPAKNRVENWGKIINEAGKTPLSIEEIERLHAMLLEDSRFIKVGLRKDEVFLGDRDRDNYPLPEFIGAKSCDLKKLLQDWIELDAFLYSDRIDPVLHAVIIAFAFVYIHPLEDGNGRLHRYFIHHVLAQRNFYPKGMIFPISSVILDEIEKYKGVLVSHTAPLMSRIEWKATLFGNVKVFNETKDLYRYFNCTSSCEFIYESVQKTVSATLPDELKYLDSFDKAYEDINAFVEMPNNKIKSLITFVLQNDGKLFKNKREKYYEKLTQDEIDYIENIVDEYFR